MADEKTPEQIAADKAIADKKIADQKALDDKAAEDAAAAAATGKKKTQSVAAEVTDSAAAAPDAVGAAQAVTDAHTNVISTARDLGSQDPPKPGPGVRLRGEDPNQVDTADNRIELGRQKQAARAVYYTGQAIDSNESFQITEPREARATASTA